jgi:hypothetical protein
MPDWNWTSQQAGLQAVATTSTTQQHRLGTIATAHNDAGEGEFIYLLGVASTVAGDVVEYDSSFQTGLASIALAVPRPLAVAMSANVASQYGWYQISGEADIAKATALSIAAGTAFGATSGKVVAAATGLVVMGGVAVSVAAAGVTTGTVMIQRPTGPSDVS